MQCEQTYMIAQADQGQMKDISHELCNNSEWIDGPVYWIDFVTLRKAIDT